MSYAPLDSDILYSTTIKEGPLVFAVWCAILASKDEYGVSALNPESLALLMTKPGGGREPDVEAISRAWAVLTSPDKGSRNQDFEGRRIIPTEDGRWLVVSHEKYRRKHMKLRRQEQLRDAKARQREREATVEVPKPPVVVERERTGGAPPNPLIAGRRPQLESAGYRMIAEISELEPEKDPTEILAEASSWLGKDGQTRLKTNLSTMSDDHLIRTIQDLKKNLEVARGAKK